MKDATGGPAGGTGASSAAELDGTECPSSLDLAPPAPGEAADGSEELQLSAELTRALEAFARGRALSLATLVHGAWAILVARLSGRSDVLLGTVVARRAPEPGGSDGDHSPAALRTRVRAERPLADWLGELEIELDLLGRPRSAPPEETGAPISIPAGEPSPGTLIVLEDSPTAAAAVRGRAVARLRSRSAAAQVLVAVPGERLMLVLCWSRGRASRASAREALRSLEQILAGMPAGGGAPVSGLRAVAPERHGEIVALGRGVSTGYPRERGLAELFAQAVRRDPEAPAVVCGRRSLSYRELEALSASLARSLRRMELAREEVVALLCQRADGLAGAMLGVLRAGGAYMPLDLDAPDERLRRMAARAGARLALCGPDQRERCERLGLRALVLDPVEEPAPALEPDAPLSGGAGEALAYVLYTSGSTGEPKGAAVTQCAIARLVLETDYVRFQPGDRVARASNPAFDTTTFEVWGALLNGALLVDVPREVLLAPERLEAHLREHGVTHLFLTTSLFHQIASERPSALRELSLLVVAGEALSSAQVQSALAAGGPRRLLNAYGPTEATTFASWHDADGSDPGPVVPLGRPLANTEVHVLDSELAPSPPLAAGEIYIGGVALARGYVGAGALTAERFVPHPFPREAGERLYRTGDLARRREDGTIEFLGRRDAQVKLRGFRVELPEIERALAEHPDLRAAAVLARQARGSGKRLVAWIVPRAERAPGRAELRAHLARTLPDYMIPSAFVPLPALPLTRNGKLDVRALPDPEESGPAEGAGAGPADGLEALAASIWCELLGLERLGRDDDVFARGAHSLLAMQAAWRLREALSCDVPLGALFEHTTTGALAAWLRSALAARRDPPAPLEAEADPGRAPLSPAQERLWILERIDPGRATYHIALGLRLRGRLDVAALGSSWRALVQRHAALRAVFRAAGPEDDAPQQVFRADLDGELEVEDLASFHALEVEARARALARVPFDLEAGPLFRARLFRLAEQDHALVLVLHHLVADGWSLKVLLRDLGQLYRACARGCAPELSPLRATYGAWARAKRAELARPRAAELARLWKEALGGEHEALRLPRDRAAEPGLRGSVARRELDPALVRRLRAFASREGATLYTVLLAGFAALLARTSGQRDLWIGTPLAGRDRREVEDLAGFFVETLVLRCQVAGEASARELFGRVRSSTLFAWSHADLPFVRLVKELQPERADARTPLFQALFVLNEDLGGVLDLGPVQAEPFEVETGAAPFEWSLIIEPRRERLVAALEHDAGLFGPSTAARALCRYERLLSAMVADPSRRVDDLAWTDAEEEAELQVLARGPSLEPRAPAGPRGPLAQEIAERARLWPDAIAVVDPPRRASYSELFARAAALARTLRERGAGPERVVAVLSPRSLELVVALLAVQRAGAAWLPLDAGLPRARIEALLRASGARLLLVHRGLLERARGLEVSVLALDETGPVPAAPAEPAPSVEPEQAAYLVFTSGSTGEPKGVLVPQRALRACAHAAVEHLGLTERDRVLHMASIGFDLSIEELFPALLCGARVVVRGEAAPPSGEELLRLVEDEEITVLDLPTAYWHEWVRALEALPAPRLPRSLRLTIVGGERADADAYRTWRRIAGPDVRWINTYGPTETTVTATAFAPKSDWVLEEGALIPIGRPIPGWRAAVLNASLRPLPIGVPGVLAVGGAGLARGYLGAPRTTARCFVPDPGSGAGGRWFLTGDRARWREDGQLEFLGRCDDQVKIRGVRVEPGEVEAELRRSPGVGEAVVVARPLADGRRQLVAYAAPRDGIPLDARLLRERLRARLPEPFVPSAFVVLPALPRTSSGKIDRAALPSPPRAESGGGAEDLDETGRLLAGIWSEVLGVERVGAADHFFELGGDSIQAIQVAARASRAGLALAPRDLFRHPRLCDLARSLDLSRPPASPAGSRASEARPGPVPLTPIQRWFFEQDLPARHHWNQSLLLAPRRATDPRDVERALALLARRHDALRLAFPPDAAERGAVLLEEPVLAALERIDLSRPLAGGSEAALERECARVQASLDPERGLLLRGAWIELGPPRGARLLLAAHHLAVDVVSWRTLLDELEISIEALERGAEPALASPGAPWSAWARALDELARSPALDAELPFWEAALRAPPPPLPRDRAAGGNRTGDERLATGDLEGVAALALVSDAPRRFHASLEELLVSALASAIVRWTGAGEAWIELEGHGREDLVPGLDASRAVGWFTTVYPVRIALAREHAPAEALRATKRVLRAIPRRGAGFALLRHGPEGARARTLRSAGAPEIAFNFLGRLDDWGGAGRFALAAEPTGPERAASGARSHLIDVQAYLRAGKLRTEWLYGAGVHDRPTIERLAHGFQGALRELLDLARAEDARALDASDFPLAQLGRSGLARVLRQVGSPPTAPRGEP